MGKQTFAKIEKTLSILFAIFLLVSLTAASVSAAGGSKEKTSVTGKASITASDPPFRGDFGKHYGDFDRDFHRDFDRDFDRHFRHFRDFDRDDFDRHFREFHRDFDRDFHGNFERHFRGY